MEATARRLGLVAALAISLGGMPGCGSSTGSDGTPDVDSMSSAQAEAFARSLSLAATSSMGSGAFTPPAEAAGAVATEVQQAGVVVSGLLSGVTCTQTSCVINQPISASRTCTAGGRIAVTGSITGSISSTGTGIIQISATETISDWMCLPPLVINGDPYVSLTGTFSFVNGVPATQQHVGINGGIKWGTTAAASCQIHLDTNFNRDGSGRTTGTVCGHTIDITYAP